MQSDQRLCHRHDSKKPLLPPDTASFVYYPATATAEAVYLLGSVELNKFICFPEKAACAVDIAFSLVKESCSLEEFRRKAQEVTLREPECMAIAEKLQACGLLGADNAASVKGDIQAVSLFNRELPVSVLLRIFGHLTGGNALHVVAIACLLGLMLISFAVGSALQSVSGAGAWWILASVIAASTIAHETAHLVAAAAAGLHRGCLRFSFLLGFIPVVALKLHGICTLPPSRRMFIWGAGIAANVAAGCGAFLAMRFAGTESPIDHSLMAVNFLMASGNLFPLLPTDGYYLLTTKLRLVNLRLHTFRFLSGLLQGKATGCSGLVRVYSLCTVVLLCTACYKSMALMLRIRPGGVSTEHVKACATLFGLVWLGYRLRRGVIHQYDDVNVTSTNNQFGRNQ